MGGGEKEFTVFHSGKMYKSVCKWLTWGNMGDDVRKYWIDNGQEERSWAFCLSFMKGPPQASWV